MKQQLGRRIGSKLAWLVGTAVAALVLGTGVTFAVAGPSETAGWPAAKAQAWQQGKAEIAAARAHPRPKPANSQAVAPPHRPDPTRSVGGIRETHQGPFSVLDFVVNNFWQGPVGADWLGVYAGAKRVPEGGTLRQGAIRIYNAPLDSNGDVDISLIGTYLVPGNVRALTITSVSEEVMALRSDSGTIVSFDLRTHQYR